MSRISGGAVWSNCPRTDVCPAKAGMFSGSQSREGNNQKPCSLDGRYTADSLTLNMPALQMIWWFWLMASENGSGC